uniref:Uncharacterized protein n=1 Tax=Rhizophora mucronata TaxID=61149 RepID=A0A2P2QXG7_RHIMU
MKQNEKNNYPKYHDVRIETYLAKFPRNLQLWGTQNARSICLNQLVTRTNKLSQINHNHKMSFKGFLI